MRATGYRTVDALVDWLTDPSQPPIRRAEPVELQHRLGGPAPERDQVFQSPQPVFARLAPAQALLLDSLSSKRSFRAGETVVERWELNRDLYVVEHGTVDVTVDGDVAATLRAGEFFGEVAALEWGAGFARGRSATVVARDDVQLRVVGTDALAQLLAAAPRLERKLRLSAHQRLRRAR